MQNLLFFDNYSVSVSDVCWDQLICSLSYHFYISKLESPCPEDHDFTDYFIRVSESSLPVLFGRVDFGRNE